MINLYRLRASWLLVSILAGSLPGCAASRSPRQTSVYELPEFYLNRRNEPGHDIVKTEQFIVPVGATVRIPGLEFDSPECTLSDAHEDILRQVFNSLEEITENTFGDSDTVRVAEFKKMEFEIRGRSFSDKQNKRVSQRCAEVVRAVLVATGTPAWRLTAKGLGDTKRDRQPSGIPHTSNLWVEFTRTN